MCVHHGDESSSQPNGPSRRAFLRTAGLVGAGAAALGPLTAGTAFADTASPAGHGRWNPDHDSLQFTLAVMPDTQFMYWGSQGSINPEPQEASFHYIAGDSGTASGDNIVFMAHLGDLTEDSQATSFQYVGKAFDILDAQGVDYSVLAGNHDVSGAFVEAGEIDDALAEERIAAGGFADLVAESVHVGEDEDLGAALAIDEERFGFAVEVHGAGSPADADARVFGGGEFVHREKRV
jgi:hypothetical protein